MGLESLNNAFTAINSVFGIVQGLGTVFVLAGIIILLGIGLGFAMWIMINIAKQLPKMSPTDFLKFMIFLAISLIVVGLVLP